jgi:succinate--hydroxymethylglutarate CoA-transferase
MSITGPENGEPVKVGVAVTDLATGLYAHGAILAALYAREKSGKGQKIELSLLETQVASLVNMGSNYLIAGKEGEKMGTAHKSIVPYQLFQTKQDDQDGENGILIGCGNNKQFEILCQNLNKPEWVNDPMMKTNELRVMNRKQVINLIQNELIKETSSFWMHKLRNSGLPCGPLNNLKQTFEHPQVLHRKMVTEIRHEKLGNIKMVGIPVKYSLNQPSIYKAPPLLGEDTEKVLKSILKMNEDEINDLRNRQVI